MWGLNDGRLGVVLRLVFYIALELGLDKQRLARLIFKSCWREEHRSIEREMKQILDRTSAVFEADRKRDNL